MSKRRSFGLTGWLTLLVIGAVVPLLLFASLTLFWLAGSYRLQADRGQADTTRALALAVEAEIRSWRAVLLTLAEARELRDGRMRQFDALARAVAARYDGWVVVNDATGQQRVNTLLPAGAPLHRTAAGGMVEAVFRDGKPVTDLVFGAAAQRHIISNSVPVFRHGRVIFCLSMNFGPERLTRLLGAQGLPSTWIAGIANREHRVVARWPHRPERIGQPMLEGFQVAFERADQGLLESPLTDGRMGRASFTRLQELPWVMTVAIPTSELQAEWWTPVVGFLVAGSLLSLLAVALAVAVSRRIARPIRRLADTGHPMLAGEAVTTDRASGIREVEQLREALSAGVEKAQAYYQERERAARAEEAAKAAAASADVLRTALAEKEAALANNETLLREVHHRVKNNLQMLCDMLYLQMETIGDTEKSLVLRDTYGRIYAIARLHEQLYQSMQSGRIRLAEYLERLLDGFENLYPRVPVKLEATDETVSLDLDRAIHVGLIVTELVTNALKHAFPGEPGEVRVGLRTMKDRLVIEVRDTGKGFPADLDIEHSRSLGLRIVRILARRLEATVTIKSDGGTVFTITLPVHAEAPVEPTFEDPRG